MNAPATSETHIGTIDGEKLAYTTVGDPSNPPLLFIHGWISYRGVWQATLDALKANYYGIALDLLGHGDSDKPADGDYSIEAQAKRVLKLADRLGVQRFGLVGHSMGGQISLTIASLLAPDRVTKLVDINGVVSGHLTERSETTMSLLRVIERFPVILPLTRPFTRFRPVANLAYGKTAFYDMRRIPETFWRAESQRLYSHPKPQIFLRCTDAIQKLDLTPHLSKITAPTLILFGKQDNTVPLSEGQLAHERIANSQLLILDECGHFTMIEQPAAYLNALQQFLLP